MNSIATKLDPYRVADIYFAQKKAIEAPALYYLCEITALKDRSLAELVEIHKAKVAYAGQRIIQESVET
jgi:hypothetical protein